MKTTTTVSAVMAACAVIAAEVRYDGDDKAVKFAAADARKILSGAKGEVGFAIDPTLAHQEWRLVAKDGRLTIYGRDGLGQVYGVYAFLDRYAGCRWYAPDTERMPDLTGWKIPDIDERRKPAIPEREMYVGGDYMDGYWRLRNLETMRVPFGCTSDVGAPGHCHTFAAYHRAIAKDLTPEMYGVDSKGKSSGQFCLSHQLGRGEGAVGKMGMGVQIAVQLAVLLIIRYFYYTTKSGKRQEVRYRALRGDGFFVDRVGRRR